MDVPAIVTATAGKLVLERGFPLQTSKMPYVHGTSIPMLPVLFVTLHLNELQFLYEEDVEELFQFRVQHRKLITKPLSVAEIVHLVQYNPVNHLRCCPHD